MQNLNDNSEINDKIISAQVSSLYSALPVSLTITIINSVLLYYIQLPSIEVSTANYWLWTMLTVVLLRFSLFFMYRFPRQDYIKRDNKIWRKMFFFTATIAATIWGASGIFLFPDNDIHRQVFLVFVIAGMASGSVATLSAHKKTVSVFLIILMSPIIIRFIIIPDTLAKIMGFMIFFSLLSFLILSKHINQQLLENIKLSIEAKFREAELLKYSSLLVQTQKLANIGGWEINLNDHSVKLSPEFNTLFDYLTGNQQEITDAIVAAAKESETFDLELVLLIPNTPRKRWIRIIGGFKGDSSNHLHGAIQDISDAKMIQLSLDRSKNAALDKAQYFKDYVRNIEKKNNPLSEASSKI